MARFVNYLLVPIQTAKFAASGGEYGVITNVYAYVAILIVLLTFGMETTFFRFMNKEDENRKLIYSTTLRMVGTVALVSTVLVLMFCKPIASMVGYADHPEYVGVMYATVAIDAFSCILFDYLRCEHKPLKFAFLKIATIVVNILLNVVYFFVLPALHINPFGMYGDNWHFDVAWVFYINIFCSTACLLFLHKELRGITGGFDWKSCRNMLTYAWPILVMGLAGQLNQCASQILFPYFYDGTPAEARAQLGIYGACIKIAMIMMMITQAFRFAYEPFVFSKTRDADNKETYAQTMKYYVVFTLLAFLVVMAYINLLRYIIGPSYWEGLRVVPIVMAAEIMFGVFFNLSFWYKLTDRTIWGAYFSGIGVVVLFAIDIIFIPRFSYMACAWAGFVAYGVSMILSYLIGQRYYPVRYPVRQIMAYVLLAVVLFVAMHFSSKWLPVWGAVLLNTLLLLVFAAYIVKRDMPLASLPVVGKYFKR